MSDGAIALHKYCEMQPRDSDVTLVFTLNVRFAWNLHIYVIILCPSKLHFCDLFYVDPRLIFGVNNFTPIISCGDGQRLDEEELLMECSKIVVNKKGKVRKNHAIFFSQIHHIIYNE